MGEVDGGGLGWPAGSEPATVGEAAEVFAAGGSVSIDRAGGDVVLSTRALNRVLEHEPGDLTTIVEAAIRLSELRARLGAHRQMRPPRPPAAPTTRACPAPPPTAPG